MGHPFYTFATKDMQETPEIPKPNPITVNGRTFAPCTDTTIEQDQLIAYILEESGLGKLKDFNPLTDDFTEVSRQLIMRAFGTGKLFTLLGAMFEDVPAQEFSLAGAEERADFLRKLKRRVDKDALKGSIVAMILSFFVSGAWFVKNSAKYSFSAATDQMPLNLGLSVEVFGRTTESGMTS